MNIKALGRVSNGAPPATTGRLRPNSVEGHSRLTLIIQQIPEKYNTQIESGNVSFVHEIRPRLQAACRNRGRDR